MLTTSSVTLGDKSIFVVFKDTVSFPLSGCNVNFLVKHATANVTSANGCIDTTQPEWR